MQRVFQALSDENRRQILAVLRNGSLPAGEIAGHLPIGKAALSHHLAILKAADLVRCERRGQLRVYSLNTSGLRDFAAWALELSSPVVGTRSRRLRLQEG